MDNRGERKQKEQPLCEPEIPTLSLGEPSEPHSVETWEKIDPASIKDLMGPASKYVKLVSSENEEFIISRKHALMSNTIRKMLDGPGQFKEDQVNVINLKGISSPILAYVCKYFKYKEDNMKKSADEDIPDFIMPIPYVLHLLVASAFLEC